MSKAITFILISTTILILFSILGIVETNTGALLSAINFANLSNFTSGEFFSKYSLIIAAAIAGGAIGIGFLVKSSPIEYIIIGLVSLLGTWVATDLVSILIAVDGILIGTEFAFIATVVKVIVTFLLVGTVLALISYWRGSDG
jgi:hypothetical protein